MGTEPTNRQVYRHSLRLCAAMVLIYVYLCCFLDLSISNFAQIYLVVFEFIRYKQNKETWYFLIYSLTILLTIVVSVYTNFMIRIYIRSPSLPSISWNTCMCQKSNKIEQSCQKTPSSVHQSVRTYIRSSCSVFSEVMITF